MHNHRQALFDLYPVLATIPERNVERALENTRLVRLKAGAVVFEELQHCNAYPFVLRGSVRVAKRSEAGREITLYNIAPGDVCVVSSACLLGNKPYNAFGFAQSDCELVMMPAEYFDRLLSIKIFREFIFSLFSKRVLELMLLIEEVTFRKRDQRLARLLINRGPSVDVSHQHLADELGTVREMITRTLNVFSDRQWVHLNRGSIEVADRQALERIATN